MRSVVEGEKVIAQMDHDVEDGAVALEVEDAFAVGEHAPFEKALDEVFGLVDDGFLVGASEPARAAVVAVVVDEPVFLSYLFQNAEFVEDDVSEVFFQSEKERLHPFGQMLFLQERIRSEKAVGHFRKGLDLEERQVSGCGVGARRQVVGLFADDAEDRERVGHQPHRAYVVFLLFDDEHSEIQDVRKQSVALDVDLHDLGKFHDFDVFLEDERARYEDDAVPDDDDELVVVPDDAENQLEHRVIHQNEDRWEDEIVDQVRGNVRFVKGEYDAQSESDGTYEQSLDRHVEQVDGVAGDDGRIVFYDGVHIPNSS